MKQMLTTEILNGLAQAASNVRHMLNKTNGIETPEGLDKRRQEGHMDGFDIKVVGETLILKYHTSVKICEFHEKDMENEIKGIMKKVISLIKKEYKSGVGSSINLQSIGDILISWEYESRTRTWMKANSKYGIKKLDVDTNNERPDVEGVEDPEDVLKESQRKWHEMCSDSRNQTVADNFGKMDIF